MNLVRSQGEVDAAARPAEPLTSGAGVEPRRWTYQPPLDGLRAVAVVAVLAYHLAVGSASTPTFWDRTPRGGFLGVDTFFVLSGFLITTLLLEEYRRRGTISLLAFWGRRARRLLPALLLVLVAVAGYAAWVARPEELESLRRDLFATMTYGANWRFITSGESYFTLFADASPLRHAWSLAIEEQFYLVWPLVALACLRWSRGRRTAFVVVCVAGTVASALTMARLYSSDDLSRAYYGTDGHAQLLLIGALLAVVVSRWPAHPRFVRSLHASGIAGGMFMLWAFVAVDDTDAWLYRGGYAVFGLAVAALIASLVQPEATPQRRLLSLAPVVWLGRISYGVYLWHWPVIVVASPARTGLDGAQLAFVRVAVTLTIATLSFYLVELPIRRGTWFRGRRSWVAWPVAFVASALVIVLSTSGAGPIPAYYGAGASVVRTGADPAHLRVLLVGDSIAASFLEGLEHVGGRTGAEVSAVTFPGCSVVRGVPLDVDGRPYTATQACDGSIPGLQADAVTRADPDIVLWLSEWELMDREVDGERIRVGTRAGGRRLGALVDEAVARLGAGGAHVVLLLPARSTPDARLPDYDYEAQGPRIAALRRVLRRQARVHPENVSTIDLQPIVCPGGPPCPEIVAGIELRPDGSHFGPEGARYVAEHVLQLVQRDLAPPGTQSASP